jgi:hypothetical protein
MPLLTSAALFDNLLVCVALPLRIFCASVEHIEKLRFAVGAPLGSLSKLVCIALPVLESLPENQLNTSVCLGMRLRVCNMRLQRMQEVLVADGVRHQGAAPYMCMSKGAKSVLMG